MNKSIKRISILLLIAMVIVILTPNVAHAMNKTITDKTNKELGELRKFLGVVTNIIIAFSLTSSVLIFIIHFIKLGSHGANPQKRSETLGNLLTTGIITAILGGIGLFSKMLLSIF